MTPYIHNIQLSLRDLDRGFLLRAVDMYTRHCQETMIENVAKPHMSAMEKVRHAIENASMEKASEFLPPSPEHPNGKIVFYSPPLSPPED